VSACPLGADERHGIRAEEAHVWDGKKGVKVPRAVYAMPIVPDFSVTYQWLRELRRFHRERMVAVHFVVPSDEEGAGRAVGHRPRPQAPPSTHRRARLTIGRRAVHRGSRRSCGIATLSKP